MIELTNLVTLDDDNEYVVAAKTVYDNRTYYFFVDINDNSNIKFLYEDGEELVEVTDDETINNILPLLIESIKEIVPDNVIAEAKNMLSEEDIKEILSQYKKTEE